MTGLTTQLCGYTKLPEPDLVFAAGGLSKHPLTGLIEHGPYGLKFGAPSRVRFALLGRREDLARLKGLVGELGRTAKPREAPGYYPEYPGFEQLLRTPIAPLEDRTVIALSPELDSYAKAGAKERLAQELFQALAQLRMVRSSFDVALVYLPHAWSACFEGDDFDFHDYLKAFCAPSNIPIQILPPVELRPNLSRERHVGP
jgi:hypothetical protein